MSSNRLRIQNRLKAEVLNGPWALVKYDRDGEARSETLPNLRPDSILVNETESDFQDASQNKQNPRQRERSSWVFQLLVSFSDGEILCSGFEDRIMEEGILIRADAALGLPQVTLEIEGAQYEHPAQKDPQSGSKVTYTFRAQLAPQ